MIGEQIYNFAEQLWGINRSITGNGVRQTLQLIQRHLPNLKIFEEILSRPLYHIF